jgi:ketosteroid isomerase-like protein
MSRENVEIVKRVQASGIDMVDLFRSSTVPDFFEIGIDLTLFESDFETQFIARGGTIAPSTQGLEGFAEAWGDWLEPWEIYFIEVEEFIDAGDEVVSLVRVHAQTARDEVPIEHRPAALWSVRAGRIARVRFYLERERALAAAGLSE